MDDDFYWYILLRMVLHGQPTGFHKRRVRISADACPMSSSAIGHANPKYFKYNEGLRQAPSLGVIPSSMGKTQTSPKTGCKNQLFPTRIVRYPRPRDRRSLRIDLYQGQLAGPTAGLTLGVASSFGRFSILGRTHCRLYFRS